MNGEYISSSGIILYCAQIKSLGNQLFVLFILLIKLYINLKFGTQLIKIYGCGFLTIVKYIMYWKIYFTYNFYSVFMHFFI